eukprot:SAG11_NODE_33576_length_276_cov_1.152542_1_plen_39_part_01
MRCRVDFNECESLTHARDESSPTLRLSLSRCDRDIDTQI